MREDLRQFDMDCLNEIRQTMSIKHQGGIPHSIFFDELRSMLTLSEGAENRKWIKKPKEGVVKGDVWECLIGRFYYKHTVHIFTYLYAEYDAEQEVVIDFHRHEEPIHGNKHVRKIKEWYFFPDGKVEFCDKDKLHQLVNDYGKPIYVLSAKSMRNGTH